MNAALLGSSFVLMGLSYLTQENQMSKFSSLLHFSDADMDKFESKQTRIPLELIIKIINKRP